VTPPPAWRAAQERRFIMSSPRFVVVLLTVVMLSAVTVASPATAQSQMTWAVHISLAPTWFDPAEHTGIVTLLMVLYAVHDALVKPMPGQPMAPSLAESWTASKDGLTYEFVLRSGAIFHNGEPVTTDDVKWSFERYRGAAAKLLKDKVAGVDVIDARRVRFRLKEPWSDFMTFYASPATGASWIVPRKYVEKVGDEGFKKAPIGAGPYRFVSFTPGVELVLEANDRYWRKTPSVKRLVFKVVPEDATRLAMLKRNEVDVAYSLRGPLAEEVKRTPGLKLASTLPPGTQWLDFGPHQWDAKSPWHDRRVRLAAARALDRNAVNQAETLGFSRVAASIVPAGFEFSWPAPLYGYDPAQGRKLLAEAGYPNGFDAGDLACDVSYASVAEATVNYLGAIGIRAKLRPMERAAFLGQWKDKKIRSLLQGGSGAFGNAATRIQNYMTSGGLYAYGSYPEIDDLFQQQARELDPKRREMLLHQIQKIAYERVMFAPIWELAFLNGVGPRVEEAGLGLIDYHPYSSPYEDLKLKTR
jgi:peptide/nickel transport system substrate-binding protein